MSLKEDALALHRKAQGKISVALKVPLHSSEDLSLAYSPGVAEPCLEIQQDEQKLYDYTAKARWPAEVAEHTRTLVKPVYHL